MGIGQTAREDTAGHSKTAVIEARVDIRDLANFARFIIDSGDHITSRSDLVWRAFRSITESLRLAGQTIFDTTEEAHSYVIGLGLGSMNRSGRGGRPMNSFTLAKKIEHEAKSRDGVTVEELMEVAKGLLSMKRELP